MDSFICLLSLWIQRLDSNKLLLTENINNDTYLAIG